MFFVSLACCTAISKLGYNLQHPLPEAALLGHIWLTCVRHRHSDKFERYLDIARKLVLQITCIKIPHFGVVHRL